jgi:hypothetical protein
MNPDGSGAVKVLQHSFHPNWSPDGSKLAFHCNDTSGFGIGICTANADGTARTQLTASPSDYHPAWSPDGAKIAFTRYLGGGVNSISIMNADGTNQTPIVQGTQSIYKLDWQPIPLPNRPPDCSGVAADPASLVPPNHRLRLVTLSGASDPDGNPVTTTVTGVTQDERVSGPGDHTSPDAVAGDAPNEVRLRAERDRRADGRVYRVEFELSDGKGGSCTGRATVEVPRRRGVPAIDSAPPSYDSFAP